MHNCMHNYEEVQLDNKGSFIIYAGGGLTRIRGEGVTPISGQSEGGHEEIGVQEGGGAV